MPPRIQAEFRFGTASVLFHRGGTHEKAGYCLSVILLPVLAGAFLEAMLAENAGVVIEASYTAYSQRYAHEALGLHFDGQYRQQALQLPLMLKIAESRTGGVYAVVGPVASVLVGNMTVEESEGGITVSDTVAPDNPVVFGVIAGTGYEVDLGSGELSFEFRYSRNLTDAFDDDPFDINSFQGLIGYGAHVQ